MSDAITGCRLTIDGQVDAGSIASIVRDVLADLPAGADTETQVLALYRWTRRNLFAYLGTVDDTLDPLNQAIRTINWWGFGLCGRLSKTFGILAGELLGHQNVRLVGMQEREVGAWRIGEDGRPWAFRWSMASTKRKPGDLSGHSSLEVRWDGRWHFLDVMVGFYRRDAAGRIVSLQEIADRPELADRPVGDPEGDMPYGPEPEIFTRSTIKFHEPGLNCWPGRLAPLTLAPGQSFTFLGEPLPGQFFLHPQMRAIFDAESIGGGPREGRRNARPARYGNGRFSWRTRLTPGAGSTGWNGPTGDWRLGVELPYPVTSIDWRTTPAGGAGDCSGFLLFPPSTRDVLLPIRSAGTHQPGPDALAGTGFELIVRAPGRSGAVDLELDAVVELNPQVTPRLRPGLNVVRLHGAGGGRLAAELTCRVAGRPVTFRLQGAGAHEVTAPDAIEPDGQTITLFNEG
ncbi:MAG: hypothetical protein BIFFINMI_03167 [Phycisphaerae bacterium]|nr:hypothetical protein [Phycisphaerae bacterium]